MPISIVNEGKKEEGVLMKKFLLLGFVGAFAAIAQEPTAEVPASNHSLDWSTDAGIRQDGDEQFVDYNFGHTYKLPEGYKIKSQVYFVTNRAKDTATNEWSDINYTHYYVRTTLSSPKLWDILGFKTNYALRYVLPTTEKLQKAGAYGVISPRLVMEKEFSSYFNMTVLPILSVQLNRNGYEYNVPVGSAKRNNLGNVLLEVVPQVKFTKNLTLTYDATFGLTVDGNGPAGQDDLQYYGVFIGDTELLYNIEALGDLGVGIFHYTFVTKFGNGTNIKVYDDSNSYAGLRLSKKIF